MGLDAERAAAAAGALDVGVVEFEHGAFDGPGHFTRAFNGPERLAFQRKFSAIPKEARSIGSVPKRWRVAMHVLALDADRQACLPCQAMSWIVTTGARNSAIRGEDWIEEEPTT